jgi:hypothetical protein
MHAQLQLTKIMWLPTLVLVWCHSQQNRNKSAEKGFKISWDLWNKKSLQNIDSTFFLLTSSDLQNWGAQLQSPPPPPPHCPRLRSPWLLRKLSTLDLCSVSCWSPNCYPPWPGMSTQKMLGCSQISNLYMPTCNYMTGLSNQVWNFESFFSFQPSILNNCYII